ncbi:MAG TPA: hypothetical protein VJ728_10925 [Candidatus Binataceae bacterium]|nr:hypothetical protein [Candidatus Binataceae bacterium]
MARTLAAKSGPFQLGSRVTLTPQGEQRLSGIRCKTGTVVGFGDHSTLLILLDGYPASNKYPAALWRVIQSDE